MRNTWNSKRIATATLMLAFRVAAVYAQEMPVNMTLSGTAAPSTVNLQTGTGTAEYRLAGNGTLGPFTLRAVSASAATPQASSSCSGVYFPVLAGEGVIRLQDGSLLTLKLTGGGDCIDFAAGVADCTRIFQVLSGTGRLKGASGGTVTLTEAVVPVVPGRLGFFAVTGGIAGAVSGIGEAQNQGGGQ
jgi:hypothetical protein